MTTVRFAPGLQRDADRNTFREEWEPFDVDGCAVEPLGSEETPGNNRDTTVARIRVFLDRRPPQIIPLTADVIAHGVTYNVTSVDVWASGWGDDDSDTSVVVDAVRKVGGGVRG